MTKEASSKEMSFGLWLNKLYSYAKIQLKIKLCFLFKPAFFSVNGTIIYSIYYSRSEIFNFLYLPPILESSSLNISHTVLTFLCPYLPPPSPVPSYLDSHWSFLTFLSTKIISTSNPFFTLHNWSFPFWIQNLSITSYSWDKTQIP